MTEIREAVRQRYAGLAEQLRVADPSCCDPVGGAGCCAPGTYSAGDLAAVGLGEGISLGCGNPTLLADLHPGRRSSTSAPAAGWTSCSQPVGSHRGGMRTAST